MIKNKRGHLEYLIENDMFSDGKIPIINSTFAYQIRQVSSDITRQTCNPL